MRRQIKKFIFKEHAFLWRKTGCIAGMFLLLFTTACGDGGKKYEIVEIKTGKGDMYLWLYDETPQHKENFIKLAKEGFYDQTQFHRIIRGFMIQGGDPLTKDASDRLHWGVGGVNYTIPAEIIPALYHKKGALAAARMPDEINPKWESSGCQFYIVQGIPLSDDDLDRMQNEIRLATGNAEFSFSEAVRNEYKTSGGTPQLDMQYTVFGQVIGGMEVVDSIAAIETGLLDQPVENITMDVNIVEMSAGKIKKKFGFVVPVIKK